MLHRQEVAYHAGLLVGYHGASWQANLFGVKVKARSSPWKSDRPTKSIEPLGRLGRAALKMILLISVLFIILCIFVSF